jgi:hypothetical protein
MTADGKHTDEDPGFAIRDDSTLDDWFWAEVGGAAGMLQHTDWGPAASTGRAIDFTEAGLKKIGAPLSITDSEAKVTWLGHTVAGAAKKATALGLGAGGGAKGEKTRPATKKQKHRLGVLRRKAGDILEEAQQLSHEYKKRGGTKVGKKNLERTLKLAKEATVKVKAGDTKSAEKLIEGASSEIDKARGTLGKAKGGVYTPPLKPGKPGSAASLLPAGIQGLLKQPGLTYAQKLEIGGLASQMAEGTQQKVYDASGKEISADSHADDIAAAKFQKPLVEANEKRIEKELHQVQTELKNPKLTHAQQTRLLAKQARLITSLGTAKSNLEGLNSTIATKPDEPEDETESETLQEINAHLAELVELTKQKDEETQRALNVSQAQYSALAQAITGVVSGQIGGRVGLGFQTPTVAGSLASY